MISRMNNKEMPELMYGDTVRYGTGSGVFGIYLTEDVLNYEEYCIVANITPELIKVDMNTIDAIWRHGKLIWEDNLYDRK